MKLQLRSAVDLVPPSLGSVLRHIPFSVRLGGGYQKTQRRILEFQRLAWEAKRDFIFAGMQSIVRYAYSNIPFYKDFYNHHDFSPNYLQDFDDIKKVPIVSKSDLMAADIDYRSAPVPGRILSNTGGTSGQPLSFYSEANPYAREWAHMHFIWAHLKYKPTDYKLTFRGQNIGKSPLRYFVSQNEYQVNAYLPYAEITKEIGRLLNSKKISYFHGYPSAIYDFSKYCQEKCPGLVQQLRGQLKGVFLCSEYPAPVYRELIENVWKVSSLSWYGHSERTVLAYEASEQYLYEPLHTYGYCEAVDGTDGKQKLIGTCYENLASPLIRYDTGDIIEVVSETQGILNRFRVSQGRVGEFVSDRNGKRIPLTALIFGRHHKIFEVARFIQVHQVRDGEATIVVTLNEEKFPRSDLARLFDSSSVDIEFKFRVIPKPYRTPAGKVPLVVPSRIRL